MVIQHVNVKIYARTTEVSLEAAIPVFHEWIRESVVPDELLIDVADYAHVPAGPGVMLVGHHAFYSLEFGPENRLGLLFNQRVARDGANVDRLQHALFRAAEACGRLEADSRMAGLRFDAGDLRIIVNDRALAPNTSATFAALRPDLEAALSTYCGGADFTCEYLEQDPRERFTVIVRSPSLAALPQR